MDNMLKLLVITSVYNHTDVGLVSINIITFVLIKLSLDI